MMKTNGCRIASAAVVVLTAWCCRAADTNYWRNAVHVREGVLLKELDLTEPRLMKAFLMRVDLKRPGIGFTATERDSRWGDPMPDYTNGIIRTRRERTVDFMSRRRAEGKNVEIAVNTAPWTPWCPPWSHTYADPGCWIVSDGVEVSSGKTPGSGALFLVRKYGRIEIADKTDVDGRDEVLFAMCGFSIIATNGIPAVAHRKTNGNHPRTAFGLSADKRYLFLLALDGRQPDYSIGGDERDLCDILLPAGAADAVNMDGGGSTSLVVWDHDANRPKMLNHQPKSGMRTVAVNFGITFPDPEIARRTAEDLAKPVRPGGVDGRPFWNGWSKWFMYPPAFDFKPVEGATEYVFSVLDDAMYEHEMRAARPTESLAKLWPKLPTGLVHVTCSGVDATGRVVGIAGKRRFWKQAAFDPQKYPKAKWSYREAALKLMDFLFDDWAPMQYLVKHGRPDPAYPYTSYPAKTGAAFINLMCRYAQMRPERKDEALRRAKMVADAVMAITPKDGPLAYMAPTYVFHPENAYPFPRQVSKDNEGLSMLRYPAEIGIAFVNYWKATGDRTYLDFALKCGETFRRLRRPDGTWPLKMRYADGKSVLPAALILIERIDFFTKLHEATGEKTWQELEEGVFAQVEKNQLATWNWVGQFEDTVVVEEPYSNHSHHDAIATALYMLRKYPGDAKRLAQAEELVRFCEDQFLSWERPCRADGTGPLDTKEITTPWNPRKYLSWRTPCVCEQYECNVPIDASYCRLIWGYRALAHAKGGDCFYLAKARALADALVNCQQTNGGITTNQFANGDHFDDSCYFEWLDCMVDDAETFCDLATDELFCNGKEAKGCLD